MEFEKIKEPLKIDDNSIVRVKTMGHITEIMFSQQKNNFCYVKKLDKDSYIDLRTGEVLEYEHYVSRADNIQRLKKSLNYDRDMINANCTVLENCRFITVTYRQRDNYDVEPVPMTDTKVLHRDIDRFYKNLRYNYGKDIRILTFCEPQGNKSWHAHIVVVFNDKAPYMPNEHIAKLWGKGFVRVERIKNDVDNIGAYLTSYLCDVDVDEFKKEFPKVPADKMGEIKEIEIENENGVKIKKKYVKGARLSYYPPNFKPFRCTRNCIKPIVENMTYKMAKEKAGAVTPTFTKTIALKEPEKDFEKCIQFEYYNSIRK